jgi:hypothetical protein
MDWSTCWALSWALPRQQRMPHRHRRGSGGNLCRIHLDGRGRLHLDAGENDLYLSEREREYRHIHLAPDVEIEEIRDIYRRKGFEGETLEKIVEVITSNPMCGST